jgi:hypothetical protein
MMTRNNHIMVMELVKSVFQEVQLQPGPAG